MVIQSLFLRLVGSIIISNLRKEKEKNLIWSEFISKVEYLETIKMCPSGDRGDDLYPWDVFAGEMGPMNSVFNPSVTTSFFEVTDHSKQQNLFLDKADTHSDFTTI